MNDWQHVQSIFLAAADISAESRVRILDELCGEDRELRREVESLLVADKDSAMTIDLAIQGVAATVLDTPVMIGERLGAYRVVREIGRGGMGSVYLAQRDDEEYTKEVALKVVKCGMNSEEVLRRFRDERQILANLDHPYIARLFDGGSTADGVPFFAMEYVEGRPVDVFCRENKLDAKGCCELFLHVLEAVAYAHRNLVVHGDLKPANIFIASDGTPKLLDFGVAKLVGNEDGAAMEARVFTPGYASPEQVRGSAVTTSTDVYSLGAVLYELLSGKRAQPIDFDMPTGIERAVCGVDGLHAEMVAKGLPADLDHVVRMALQKEPGRRYQSATQFAEDIRCWLQGRPVIAREGSVGYRARKFIMRNALLVAMATTIAAAIVGGLVVSLVQTHRARTERAAADSQRQIALSERSEAEAARASESVQRVVADQQRQLAEEQRGIAETERDEARNQKSIADKRLQEMMRLAEKTLFDVHDDVASLPGSIAARRKIVQTTLEYLQSLQKDIGNNDDMRQMITAAYYKVALIQGDPRGSSLQDSASEEKTLLKAQELLLPAYRRHPDDAGLMLRWIEIRSGLAELAYRSGRLQEGVQIYSELIPVTRRLRHAKDCALNCEMQEGAIENALANLLLASDPARALEHANRSIELCREVAIRHPEERDLKQGLGVATGVAAAAYKSLGNLEKASEYYRQSIAVREELLRENPDDVVIRRSLLVMCGNYATLLGIPWSQNLGQPTEARAYAARGVAIAREMASVDPKDATAHRDLGMILGRFGMIDPAPGEVAASLASLQEAGNLLSPLAMANPKSFEMASQLAQVLQYQAHRLGELGRTDNAVQAFRKAMALLEPFIHQPKLAMIQDYIWDQDGLAALYASTGDSVAALDMANKALASAQTYAAVLPSTDNRIATLAAAWANLALVQSKTGWPEPARQNAQKAMQMWSTVKNPGILTAYRKPLSDAKTILGLASN